MSTRMTEFFSESYPESRQRFRDAASGASSLTRLWSESFHALDAQGRRAEGRYGEELATDFAWFGAADAPCVLILSCGTHGAEGLAGAGAQLAALATLVPELPFDRLALLMIHGLNPWGCSHERRCDHQGVDVMRNFIDFSAPPPPISALQRRYMFALSPSALHGPRRWLADAAVLWAVMRYGLRRLQAEVPRGQYVYSDAPFFGGFQPSWTRNTLERHLKDAVGRSRPAVAMIDVHTGLGDRGKGVLLAEHAGRDEPAAARASAWWGDRFEAEILDSGAPARSGRRQPRTAYELHGSMPRAIRSDIFQDESVVSAVLEFGTLPRLDVMDAVRDDHAIWRTARARGLAEPDGFDPDVIAVRSAMREAFYPPDKAWRTAIAEQTIDAVRDAAMGLLAR